MVDVEKETEIQWVKPGSAVMSCILGKDIAVLTSGNFINFVETSRAEKKDLIYHANNEVRGDGIQCICTHKTLPCFAIAEMCRNPRILIISYPNFEVLKSFESVTDTNYFDVKFSEMEYLIALTGIPDYKIVIWNWRTSEKIYSKETKLENPNQSLRVSPTSPIQILQSAFDDRQVYLWNLNVCYKKIIFKKTAVVLPDSSQPPYCFSYGVDEELYFVDSGGCLHQINTETRGCVVLLPWRGENTRTRHAPCLASYKGGLVFTTPREVHFCRKKSAEGWTLIWNYVPKTPLGALLSSSLKDHLLGITKWNEVIVFKGEPQVECATIRSYGSDFEFLSFVQPVGDYFLTFGNSNKLFTIWNKASGQKVSQLVWTKRRINGMEGNTKRPYAAVVTEDGRTAIINAYDPNYVMELDDVALTRNSLNAIRFGSQGILLCVSNTEIGEFFLLKLPAKLDVSAHVKIDLKIVDYALHETEDRLHLLIVPMSQLCCRSGHNLMIYSFSEKPKTFEFIKDVPMPWVATSITPSPTSPRELLCIPHRSRQVGVLNIQSGKAVDKFVSGHQMKIIYMKCEKDYLLTYGADGMVIVNLMTEKKCFTIFATHHRLAKGVKSLAVDPYVKYVLTLGENGSVVCTVLRKTGKTDAKQENENLLASPQYKQIFHNPVVSEKTKAKAFEKLLQQNVDESKDAVEDVLQKAKGWEKIWLEVRRDEDIYSEELRSRKEKLGVTEELENIRHKLKDLLDENLSNAPERQLPVQAFDLDKATRRKKLEDGKLEREKERQIQIATMKNLNKITDVIKKVCWDGISAKGREIRALLAPTAVQSYGRLPDKSSPLLRMKWLADRLQIEKFFHEGDFFQPWVPRTDSSLEMHINSKFQVSSIDITHTIKTKFKEEHLDDEKVRMDMEEEKENLVWSGTSTHHFVAVDPNHHSQFELTTFLQGHQEIRLIQTDIKKLMLWFNKEFEETFESKEQEMAFINDRNNQFRHIISDLAFFHFSPHICRTQIHDPQWAPQENPDSIMTVKDEEITVPKYVSDSEMELMKAKKLEEEKLRLLLMADDFKEKALMAMMDGVLEKLWEDEIKKEVPKPKCMIEKEVEAWNEDDLKAVKGYEEAVKTLQTERERYRKILEDKWAKTVVAVKDSVAKFDEKVMKLNFLKLKVESAIGQETLKCLRIRQRCFERIQMDRKEETIISNLVKNEKKMESMASELNKLIEMLNECKNYYESLQNKDRNLEKIFKREFPEYSPIVCEQLFKLSKKRPKLVQKAAAYSTVLIDLGKCAVTGGKAEYLPAECIQYLKDIDALDAHSNAPASVSQQSWELACKMRRLKIDTELKIRACAIDVADAEATIFNYQKALRAAKDYQTQLQNDLQALRTHKLNSSLNGQIQLVMKKGLVEVPLTGQISDFADCILVTKETLNDINKAIHKMGLQKIKAMQKAANFRKGIIYKEWEHKKLRMEIEDLKIQLDTVEKLQVLKELQAILVARARGFSDEKGFLYIENEITKVKEKFEKVQNELFSKMDDLELKIQKINLKNENLDGRIEELNVEVNEANLGRDKDFDEKTFAANQQRMKKIRERSNLMRKIQRQHNEILLLQTELELLRLKTYPTIKYKIL